MTAAPAVWAAGRVGGGYGQFVPWSEPAPGLRLFAAELDSPEPELAGDEALLSADERGRAARFHFTRDRIRFTRARAFLRRVLSAEAGCPPAHLSFRYGPNGKPALAAGPRFNLSHSGDLAVLAVSAAEPVGIDVELVSRELDPLSLAGSVFRPAETEVIAALDEPERSRRFLEFWTAKEALMKLTGAGMSLAPRTISLRLRGGRPVGYAEPPARLIPAPPPRADAVCAVAIGDPFAEGGA